MARLLLVDDDDLLRRTAARVLSSDGHRVDEASTAARAAELVVTTTYDRAIVDVHLPDGDGLDLLDWMRHRGLDLRVLVLTGDLDPRLSNRAFLLDAVLVHKPATAEVLRRFACPTNTASAALLESTRVFANQHGLSPRQTDLLVQVVRGTARKSLCRALDVEENTVKTMVRAILEKTRTDSIDDLRCALLARS